MALGRRPLVGRQVGSMRACYRGSGVNSSFYARIALQWSLVVVSILQSQRAECRSLKALRSGSNTATCHLIAIPNNHAMHAHCSALPA